MPLDEFRLRNCLQGNRATAAPEDRTSILDSRLYSNDTPWTVSRTRATPRTSVPLPVIPFTEEMSRHSTSEYSPPSPRQSQEIPEGDDSSESEGNQSDSEPEALHNHQAITPCRTPGLSNASRATPGSHSSDSVMSFK